MPRVYSDLHAFFKSEGRGTQTRIARELDVTPGHLSMIKWHQREPDLPLALRIAERCHVPLESLMRPRKPKPATVRPRVISRAS